jgi:hypothetical protein
MVLQVCDTSVSAAGANRPLNRLGNPVTTNVLMDRLFAIVMYSKQHSGWSGANQVLTRC